MKQTICEVSLFYKTENFMLFDKFRLSHWISCDGLKIPSQKFEKGLLYFYFISEFCKVCQQQ